MAADLSNLAAKVAYSDGQSAVDLSNLAAKVAYSDGQSAVDLSNLVLKVAFIAVPFVPGPGGWGVPWR